MWERGCGGCSNLEEGLEGKRILVVQLLVGAIPGSVLVHGVLWTLEGWTFVWKWERIEGLCEDDGVGRTVGGGRGLLLSSGTITA